MQAFHETQSLIPCPLDRVILIQQTVSSIDFASLWTPTDKILLYVNAHDRSGVPLVDHVLQNALPHLPDRSVVIIDGLWHSPLRLDPASANAFLATLVRENLDPLQLFEGFHAPYWNGGSFMGFAAVHSFLRWVNHNQVPLSFSPSSQAVCFEHKCNRSASSDPSGEDTSGSGKVIHNPYAVVDTIPQPDNEIQRQALALDRKLRSDFEQGALVENMLDVFNVAKKLWPQMPHVDYCRALCLLSQGSLLDGLGVLESAPQSALVKEMADAVRQWLSRHQRTISLATETLDLTLFALPKAFAGHTGIIQRNALTSWTQLYPRPHIILLGDDPGVREFAQELHLQHIPHIERTASGTPLVSSLFQQAQEAATTSVLAYCNADVILLDDFPQTLLYLQQIAKENPCGGFLLSSQRVELDITQPIDFDAHWVQRLRQSLYLNGVRDYKAAIEMFCFSRGLYDQVPPFAIGRMIWDQWLVWKAKSRGAKVIDASGAFTLIHQAHDYGHIPGGHRTAWFGEEARRNQELAGKDTLSMSEATTHFINLSGVFEGRPPEAVSARALVRRRMERGLEELRRGNPRVALDYLDDAHLRSGNQIRIDLCLARATCLLQLRNFAVARELVQAVLRSSPHHPEALRLSALLAQ